MSPRFQLLRFWVVLTMAMAGMPGRMALLQCPECRRQVSDQATQCPGCGLPGDTIRRSGLPAAVVTPPVSTTPAPPPWADTQDSGFQSAPFAWSSSGGDLKESGGSLTFTPGADGTGELYLRLKPPAERGMFLVQWLVDSPNSSVQIRSGQEVSRPDAPGARPGVGRTDPATRRPEMGSTQYSSIMAGRSSSTYAHIRGDAPVLFTLGPSPGGITVRRVRVYWRPMSAEGGGFASSLSPPPLQAQQEARESTRAEIRNTVLLVEAGDGSGSAFLAKSGDEVFIFTNQHVLGGARRLTFRSAAGTTFTPVSMEVAEKEDLVRFGLKPEISASLSKVFTLGSQDPRNGEAVTVYGNSQGAGTVSELTGSVMSFGPQLLEVSAPFVEGNSGGPICNAAGEVIGVSSFVKRAGALTWVSADSPFARNRRFGYRITPATRWIKVQPQAFLAQARTVSDSWLFLGALGSSLGQLKVVRFGSGSSAAPFLDVQYFKNEADRAFFDPKWSQQLDAFIRRFGYTEGSADRRLNPSEIERHMTNLRQEYIRMIDICAAELDRTRWMTGYLRERAAESKALAEAVKNRVNAVIR